jgi:hypothetical protein
LFLLFAEILSILIKYKCITVGDKEHKISQYADDISLALDGTPKSLCSALDTLNFFSRLSGLKVNSSKTKIIWIGSKHFQIRSSTIPDGNLTGVQQHLTY